jgi:hypothetical protein
MLDDGTAATGRDTGSSNGAGSSLPSFFATFFHEDHGTIDVSAIVLNSGALSGCCFPRLHYEHSRTRSRTHAPQASESHAHTRTDAILSSLTSVPNPPQYVLTWRLQAVRQRTWNS